MAATLQLEMATLLPVALPLLVVLLPLPLPLLPLVARVARVATTTTDCFHETLAEK